MAKRPAARAMTADVAEEECVVCVTSVAASAARSGWATAITGPRAQDAHYYIRDERVAQGVGPAYLVTIRARMPDGACKPEQRLLVRPGRG